MTTISIHDAELEDIQACRQLDASYLTDYVWQLQTQEKGRTVSLRFDTVRLPRPMPVEYPRLLDELTSHWEEQGCFLIARNREQEIVGFLDAYPNVWQKQLVIYNLVIDKPYRRQKVGTSLLEKAKKWAEQSGMYQIMLDVQTKNHPGIAFAQKHGFQFCGYNELYYSNGDITLFFARSI